MDLKKEIEKRGLRQDWVAKQIGITPSYLSMIIRGERNLKKNTQLRQKIITFFKERAA